MKYSCSKAKAWLGRRVINYKKNQYVKFNLTSRLYNLNGSSYDISLRRKRMKMENKIVNKKRKSNIKAMRLVVPENIGVRFSASPTRRFKNKMSKKSYKSFENVRNNLTSKQYGYNNKSDKINNNLNSNRNHIKSEIIATIRFNSVRLSNKVKYSKFKLSNNSLANNPKLNCDNKVKLIDVHNDSRLSMLSFIFLLSTIIIFSASFISAQATTTADTSQVSYCCEKTLSGAYCQNAQLEQCDPNFQKTPTSCESTSYCKKGCCYDSNEGICMENTPREACKANNGAWSDSAS